MYLDRTTCSNLTKQGANPKRRHFFVLSGRVYPLFLSRPLRTLPPGEQTNLEQSPHTGNTLRAARKGGGEASRRRGERLNEVAPLPPGLSDDDTSEAPPFKVKQVAHPC